MRITKFVHSCLLVEESGKVILIDPGNYTFEENVLNLDSIKTLDYLLITHQHPDHMYPPLIKEIISKFPDVKIISNPSVAEILGREGINVETRGDDFIGMEVIPHEKSWMGEPDPNCVFNVNNKLTHPGDSHHFTSTTQILALPVQAPWGSTKAAVLLADKLKPKVIIPIHDWHWNPKAREAMYKRLEEYFTAKQIRFLSPQVAVGIDVEV